MAKPLVIFGSSEMGEVANYYFTREAGREVAAFTLDCAFIKETSFCGKPVVAFEDVLKNFPPEKFELFVALGYARVNELRKEKYLAAKAMGYALPSFISKRSTVLNDGKIGENCFIFEDNTIQPFVKIGNNVTLWSGNHIGHHSNIQDHCFLTSHVVVSGSVTIGEQTFIGVNATLRDHITIGEKCVIGAGTLILDNAAADGLYIGKATERSERSSSTLKKI